MRKVILYKKLRHRLFQSCVKNSTFLLILFVFGILCAFVIASHTYTGKYFTTDGTVSTDSKNSAVIKITVDADLVPDIVHENNIKWYTSAENVRCKAVIKEIFTDKEGVYNLVLQPENHNKYKIESGKKVYVIVMYGRKYVF